MSGRHALPSRVGRLYREVAKFGAVGLSGFLVNAAAFNLIRRFWGLQTVRASVIATLISIACNYVGYRYFAYRRQESEGRSRELGLFLFFSLVGLIIENSVLYVTTYGFGWDGPVESNVFKFAGVGVATVFRFWSYRTWVFTALPAAQPLAQQDEAGPRPASGVPPNAFDEMWAPAEAPSFPAAVGPVSPRP